MSLNIIDVFCGTGSFSHGFIKQNDACELVMAVDILKTATDTVKLNNPKCHTITDDIRKINLNEAHGKIGNKKIHVIIGGPPCQGFSSLRPNRATNFNDSRNNLFEEFARFVAYFKPTYFVLENVVGILTHNKGNTLKRLTNTFDRLGYKTKWKILNAANYGVPQKRERFILIGTANEELINFPLPTHFFNGKTIGYKDRTKLLTGSGEEKPAVTMFDAISDLPIINSGEKSEVYAVEPENAFQKEMRFNSNKLTLHEASNHSEKMLEIIKHSGDNIKSIPRHLITSGFSSCYSRMKPSEPANTITVKFRSPSSSKCIHPFQDRSITIREAARLQTFEDTFKFAGSNTDISALIGNAVPSLLGKAIARNITVELLKTIEAKSIHEE